MILASNLTIDTRSSIESKAYDADETTTMPVTPSTNDSGTAIDTTQG